MHKKFNFQYSMISEIRHFCFRIFRPVLIFENPVNYGQVALRSGGVRNSRTFGGHSGRKEQGNALTAELTKEMVW